MKTKYNVGDILVKKTSASDFIPGYNIGTVVLVETYMRAYRVQWSDGNISYSYTEGELDTFHKHYVHYPVKV